MVIDDMSSREVPASIGQRLLWHLDRYRGESGALNCPMVCRIKGAVEISAVIEAIDYLTTRHEALRTTFTRRKRQLTQVIHQPRSTIATFVDHSGTPDPEAAVHQALMIELRTRVDPATWPVRVTVWRISNQVHILCMNMHHLVTDTWSCGLLFRELSVAYARCHSGGPELPALGWQHSQFVAWQEQQFNSDRFLRHTDFWRRQLMDLQVPNLPLKSSPSDTNAYRASEQFDIRPNIGIELRRLARAHRTTLFAVLLSVYYTLIHRLTSQDDIAVATLFANRTRPELENTVGFLANMVVLRSRLPKGATFIDVIRCSRMTILDAFAHQELPYHLVPQSTSPTGSLRVDDVVFQMLVERIDQTLQVGDVEFQGIVPDVVGRFDFELALMPRDDGFSARLYYTVDRLDPVWARRFISAYASTAGAVVADPEMSIDRLTD